MSLTFAQLDRIIADHESGVQVTGDYLDAIRHLAATMRERDALLDAAITARTYLHNGHTSQAERLLGDALGKGQGR